MPAAYSADIQRSGDCKGRERVSRREAADQFEVSPEFSNQMGFFRSGDWKLCGQAARREHVAVGEAHGLFAGAD